MKYIWFIIFASTFLRKDCLCQRVIYPDESGICSEKTGKKSYCVQITECSAARDSLKEGRNPITCGFSGDVPLVCCLTDVTPAKPEITPDLQCGKNEDLKETGVNWSYENDSYVPVNSSERSAINTDGSFIIQPRILSRDKFRVSSRDWPWMIAIYLKSDKRFVCNGFLIDNSHLLTAAHCFYRDSPGRQPQDYYVGTIENEETVSAEVTELHVHNLYGGDYYKDVALLKISPQLGNVVPICMPSSVNKTNHVPEEDKFLANTVTLDWIGNKYVSQRAQVVEIDLCDHLYRNLSNSPFPIGITSEFMCAIPSERTNDVCQVHSGGPVMIQANGVWRAVGIATFGVPCTLPTYPAVYTKIAPYLEWIKRHE